MTESFRGPETSAPPPLLGRRVLVTRPVEQAGELVWALRALGAEPVVCPMIRIMPPEDFGPLDTAIKRLAAFDWVIFTSANAVRMFAERLQAQAGDVCNLHRVRVGAIGGVTAAALQQAGIAVTFIPDQAIGEALSAEIGDVGGQRILLPVSDIARTTVAKGLRAKGADVHVVIAYRTVCADALAVREQLSGAGLIDIATFTSPSAVRNFANLLDERSLTTFRAATVVACLGPTTAEAARSVGLRVDIQSPAQHTDGLLVAIVAYMRETKHGSHGPSSVGH